MSTHGACYHLAVEQKTEAEKWSLNPWIPFMQMQSLLSKERMRRVEARPAGRISETGKELSKAQRSHGATAVGRAVSAQGATVCVLRKDSTNYTVPLAAFTSRGNEPPLLSISIKFRSYQLLAQHSTPQ